MKKEDVIKHFGSVNAVAVALGIKSAAVSQWGEYVPVRRAYEIEKITSDSDQPLKYQKPRSPENK